MDENLVIVFKRAGADPDKTPAHSLVEGTSTTNMPPGAETLVIVYGHNSSEGARECDFYTGRTRKNVQAKKVVLCAGRAELEKQITKYSHLLATGMHTYSFGLDGPGATTKVRH